MDTKTMTTSEKIEKIEDVLKCKIIVSDLDFVYDADSRPDYFLWKSETADGYECYILKESYTDNVNPMSELFTSEGVDCLQDEVREILNNECTIRIDDMAAIDLDMEVNDDSDWVNDDFWDGLYQDLEADGHFEEDDPNDLFFEEAKIQKEDNQ